MVQLIFYGILAAVLAGGAFAAWSGFKNYIGQPFAEAQRKADQVAVNKAEAAMVSAELERDHAVQDRDLCLSTSAKQTDLVNKWKDVADRNAAAARDAKAQAAKDATAAAPKIADLQAKAAAAPKLMACEEELGKAKDVLREALRARRATPVTPK